MLLGYLLLSAMPLFIKAATTLGWESAPLAVARFGLGCLLVPLVALGLRQRLATHQPWVLLLRGLFGAGAVLTYFVTVRLVGPGMGTLLNYTHAIWANVLGVLVLRQRPTLKFWGLLALATLGLCLIVAPQPRDAWAGHLYGALSGLFAGAAILCIKRLRKTDNALTVLASFSVVGLLVSLAILPWSTLPPAPHQPLELSGILLAVGGLSFVGQVLFTHGYKDTSVELGSLLSLGVPVVSMLLSRWWFAEPLTLWGLLGSVCVLCACLLFARLEPSARAAAPLD